MNYDRNEHIDIELLEGPYADCDVHPVSSNMGSCSVNVPNDELAYDLEWNMHKQWEACFFESSFNYQPKPRNRLKKTGKQLIEWIQNVD